MMPSSNTKPTTRSGRTYAEIVMLNNIADEPIMAEPSALITLDSSDPITTGIYLNNTDNLPLLIFFKFHLISRQT
jgi:hypothetical protein